MYLILPCSLRTVRLQTEFRGHVSYVAISIPFAILSVLPPAESPLACGVRPKAQTSDTPTFVKRGALHAIYFTTIPPALSIDFHPYIYPQKNRMLCKSTKNRCETRKNASPSSRPPQVTEPSHFRFDSSHAPNNFHIFHILFTSFARQKQIQPPPFRCRSIRLHTIFAEA